MNLFKRIFGALWTLWGFIWLMLILIVFTPTYAVILGITGKKFVKQLIWINCHYLSPFLLGITLIRLKVFGREHIDTQRTYVFVANHRSMVDIIAGGASMPIPAKFLAKKEVNHIPLFGYMVKMIGIIVDRQNAESREKSIRVMVENLLEGYSVFLYPEGTRNRAMNKPLKDFKDGAFRVAVMAQVPIAVQTIVGAMGVNDPRYMHLAPGEVTVHYSKPIETKGLTLEDVPLLKEKVREEMLIHLA